MSRKWIFPTLLALSLQANAFLDQLPIQQSKLPACTPALTGEPAGWFITKTQWDEADEKEYSEWIMALYNSKCNSLASCLASSANKFAKTDGIPFNLFSDCADFPFKLRMYFAWKKGLPFSYNASVAPRSLPESMINAGKNANDIRYTPQGNKPASRRAPHMLNGGIAHFPKEYMMITNATSTATLRLNPMIYHTYPNISDTYPIPINRDAFRAGTVAYDANGHAAIVIRANSDGTIDMFDAKADGKTVTRPTYPFFKYFRKFYRPDMGVVFQRFRPIVALGFEKRTWGNKCEYFAPKAGSVVRPLNDSEIKGVSYEQATGTEWKPGQAMPTTRVFRVNGKIVDDHVRFVRERLAGSGLKLNPRKEFSAKIKDLCDTVNNRAKSVENARVAGIHLKNFPETGNRMSNVYGGSGDWFALSTPSTDLGIRKDTLDLIEMARGFIVGVRGDRAGIDYAGTADQLKQEFLTMWNQEAAACVINYTKSDGKPSPTLNLESILARTKSMSFNPFDCPERRWGALNAAELATCQEANQPRNMKNRWYTAMQPLRNTLEKDENMNMDFTIEELEKSGTRLGPAQAPNLNVKSQLQEM